MHRIVLASLAAIVLFAVDRSAAQTTDGSVQVTEYFFTAFTFSRPTRTLVGSIGCGVNSDFCSTVTLVANDSTVFRPTDRYLPPTFATDPLYGLFTAWNALTSSTEVQWTREPSYSLLVAMGLNDARAIATTLDGVSLLSVQPVEARTTQCAATTDCPSPQVCIGGSCAYAPCASNDDCAGTAVCIDGFCLMGGGTGKGCSGACP